MRTLVDVACEAGHFRSDVWIDTAEPLPPCVCLVTRGKRCGLPTIRASAPNITPQGTRAERNFERPREPKVDSAHIARETAFEVEQKWLRYSDEQIAEQHISREINEAAGIADAAGNEKPIPKPDPIMFAKPSLAECAS
jgi:hypothetical protein